MVQWLGLRALTAVGLGLIPAQGTKILQAMQCGDQKKKKKNLWNSAKAVQREKFIEMQAYLRN